MLRRMTFLGVFVCLMCFVFNAQAQNATAVFIDDMDEAEQGWRVMTPEEMKKFIATPNRKNEKPVLNVPKYKQPKRRAGAVPISPQDADGPILMNSSGPKYKALKNVKSAKRSGTFKPSVRKTSE